MASEFSLEVVTPDKIFYHDNGEMVITRTTEGDRGILRNHRPFVAGLVEGILRVKKNGNFKEAKISGGFITVDKEKATILTESAEWI